MNEKDFETSFSEFIDSEAYDKADAAFLEMLFNTARASYKAGWIAAGGEAPQKNSEVLTFKRPPHEITVGTESE